MTKAGSLAEERTHLADGTVARHGAWKMGWDTEPQTRTDLLDESNIFTVDETGQKLES